MTADISIEREANNRILDRQQSDRQRRFPLQLVDGQRDHVAPGGQGELDLVGGDRCGFAVEPERYAVVRAEREADLAGRGDVHRETDEAGGIEVAVRLEAGQFVFSLALLLSQT